MAVDHLAWPHQLRRRFRLLIFDWDGTAVEDRELPLPELARAFENLLKRGVILCLITGTKLDLAFGNCISLIAPDARKGLFAFTHRGSEVWRFDDAGQPLLVSRHEATERENRALDLIARNCLAFLASQGIRAEVISNRLNRRKIDLIPSARWRSPRKSEIKELLQAVQRRLAHSKLKGGLAAVLDRAREEARRAGLDQARITSDVKHVEIGLTDKSDSIHWILKNLIEARSISSEDVSVFGDEFGTVGEDPGSDARMQVPELKDRVFCSVGVEPAGVPEGVLRLEGGPRRFRAFLEYQEMLWADGIPNLFERPFLPNPNPSWCLEQEGFDASLEHEMETLFALGNGRMGARASATIPIPSSQPELYVAGVYDRKAPRFPYSETQFIASEERPSPYTEIVPFPSPFRFAIRVEGEELTPGSARSRGHERILDLKSGLLFELFYLDGEKSGQISVRTGCALSLGDSHLALQEIIVEAEDRAVSVELELCPPMSDFGFRYPHLRQESADGADLFETSGSQYQVAIAMRWEVEGKQTKDNFLKFRAAPGRAHRIRTLASVFSSRDGEDPANLARASLGERPFDRFDQALSEHREKWREFWQSSDIRFAGNPSTTQAMRFDLYHLRCAAPARPDTSVGARGLTGRSYEGHIFWDAEIFIFPFYLFCLPDAARNVLLYRYHTLDGARARAKELGFRGACYAWESTVDGSDVTPSFITLLESKKTVSILTGRQQIHVTADVAYAVTRYWEATGDDEFMFRHGVEILIETARFWSSRVTLRKGRFHILGVIGPDEYHQGVNDNAYTNWMARFNLEKALSAVSWLRARDPARERALLERLRLDPAELAQWGQVRDLLYLPKPNQDGIIEQFEGFFELDEAKVDERERLRPPVGRLLSWEQVNRSKTIKQADVLMIPFLFPDALPKEIIERNFRYYAPLTNHGSSLSPCVHATVAADVGLVADASRYWEESLYLDLRNLMRNTALGIHLGCMGGTWQALVFHLRAMRFAGGVWMPRAPGPPPGPRIQERDVA